ncbi:MAG TPA: hypothetical protein VMR62_08610 [Bryobacteraceae bacterium]|jgi:DNA-directed RNA polymerase subunit RPC12/RpoP|nr:hypothetical protein [Bryobacteraceae bacterium]
MLLGDQLNGFLAAETVRSIDEIIPWLQEAIAHFYPMSTYAGSLASEVKARAAQRLFRPPEVGQSVKCPHCGAPNEMLMDEVFAFVCQHCGESVKVEPPKVQ